MTATEQHQPDLREYFSVLRSRRLEVVLVTLVLVGVTLFLSFRQTKIYEARAKVLVRPLQTATSGSSVPQQPDLDTERELLVSQAVADEVRKDLHLTMPLKDLLRDLRVQVVTDTAVLQVAYDDPSPQEAARLANGFANAYVSFRVQQAQADFAAASEAVSSRITDLQDQISRLTGQINATKDQVLRDSLQTRRDTLIVQLGVLNQRLLDLQANSSVSESGAAQIIQTADVPGSPISPNPVRNGVLALMVGIALGVGFAFLRERLDDRLKTVHEAERRLGVPVLAAVPHVGKWRKLEDTQLVMKEEPKSPVAESYRTLGTNIQYLGSQQPMSVIMVTSATGGDGKTTTAANLGMVLAHAGKRVILLSADLRRPRLHQFFGLTNGVGLSDALVGPTLLAGVVDDPGIDNLRVVNAGPMPNDPAALLGSSRMPEFLQALREVADFVIVDTPPVLAVADASILAPLMDGTIFVLDATRSKRSVTGQAREQLEKAGAKLVGSVYNNFDPTTAGRYPYYYDYYYQYSHYTPTPSQTNGNGKLWVRPGVK
jgi:capsular exopolysaccharide synthesis family protein